MPPEYVAAGRLAASVSEKRSSSSSARARASVRGRSSSRPIRYRFSQPGSFSSTEAYCPVRPITRRSWRGCRTTS
ncbi:hypothetical protein SGLAM104S_07188 [Streptomyces glaucescens]